MIQTRCSLFLIVTRLKRVETRSTRKRLSVLDRPKKTRGVIIFTDPDTPGEHIRRLIGGSVPRM